MLTIPFIVSLTEQETPPGRPRGTIHFNEETISLCHPERSEGSLAGQRSFATLRMTLLHRLRLTRKTSSLKWIDRKGSPLLYDGSARQARSSIVGAIPCGRPGLAAYLNTFQEREPKVMAALKASNADDFLESPTASTGKAHFSPN